MPNDNIIAQAADGTQHVFPVGTDVAVIDAAMKRYVSSGQPGAMQSFRGGPVVNAKNLAPAPDSGATVGSTAREGGLGLASAVLPEGSMSPDWKQNLSTIGTGLNTQVNKAATTPWGQGGPLYGVIEMLAKGLMGGAHGVASGVEEMGSGMWNKDPEKVAHGGGAALGNAATLGLLKKAPEAIADPLGKASLAGMGREVMGEGASKARVLGDLHAHAIETQKHIAGVADAVHTDAQQAMARVSQAVDAAKPEGAFDKTEIRDRLNTAMGDTLEDQNQLPTSLKKLTTPEKPTMANYVNKNTADFINRLKQGGLENDEIAQAMKEQGFQANEIKAALGESGAQPGRMTFEEVKQARSDLGRQMGRLQGPAQAAASAAYGELSKVLREGARDNRMEPDWIDANARYKNYMDDFVRSPLAKTLEGENASDIMDPLTGKSRVQVGQILQKYTPFGLDMDRINQEVSRSGVGEMVGKLSRPTKMDLLMAGFSPKALAVRQLGPRLMRNPSMISAVGGKGFDIPEIKTEKVFPSQKAAGGGTPGAPIPQGKPTPFGSSGGINAKGLEESMRPTSPAQAIQSLSSEIDTMKGKLRDAKNAPMTEKKALQKQIQDYQQRLDELRGTT